MYLHGMSSGDFAPALTRFFGSAAGLSSSGITRLTAQCRADLLSPFDRLIHDRKRNTELFEFNYQLEMYKPAAKRRWG